MSVPVGSRYNWSPGPRNFVALVAVVIAVISLLCFGGVIKEWNAHFVLALAIAVFMAAWVL